MLPIFLVAMAFLGLSYILRPFIRIQPVELGKLLLFGVAAYIFIVQGKALMRDAEQWRGEAGAWVYSSMAESEIGGIEIPGNTPSTDDPLYPPTDLDGVSPIRGWEAVASTYFLVTSSDDLHGSIPPPDFRLAYCLYDPSVSLNEQEEENNAGCSPKLAWDEWDTTTTVITLPFPIEIGIELPLIQDHPENRQLGIRQAQAGVARLALGPIVALSPMIEANIALMLTLSASFIYLSLPILLMFGFFRATEPLVNRLIMQFIMIMVRTLIIQGLSALFLMMLISVAVNGSLTSYLGLIGVGLMGGWFLIRMATATMKETMSQSLGAVGKLWTGAATLAFGEAARRPAEKAMGAAKVAATGAALFGAGAAIGPGMLWDLGEPAYDTLKSGQKDLTGNSNATWVEQKATALPPAILAMAIGNQQATDTTSNLGWQNGSSQNYQRRTPQPSNVVSNQAMPQSTPFNEGNIPPNGQINPTLSGWINTTDQPSFLAPQSQTPNSNPQAVDNWAKQWYTAQEQGQGLASLNNTGQQLLGQDLGQATTAVMTRHNQADTLAVLTASQQLSQANNQPIFQPDGSLSSQAVQTIQANLEPSIAQTFKSYSHP